MVPFVFTDQKIGNPKQNTPARREQSRFLGEAERLWSGGNVVVAREFKAAGWATSALLAFFGSFSFAVSLIFSRKLQKTIQVADIPRVGKVIMFKVRKRGYFPTDKHGTKKQYLQRKLLLGPPVALLVEGAHTKVDYRKKRVPLRVGKIMGVRGGGLSSGLEPEWLLEPRGFLPSERML